MHLDGDLVPPAAPGWQNPYRTTRKTRGHFSFWPRATRSERASISAELLFIVDHPDFESFRAVETVITSGDFDSHDVIQGDKILSLTPFALVPKA